MANDGNVALYVRPEFENPAVEEAVVGDIERRLSLWERFSNMDPVRKFSVLILLVVSWELYTRIGGINELMFRNINSLMPPIRVYSSHETTNKISTENFRTGSILENRSQSERRRSISPTTASSTAGFSNSGRTYKATLPSFAMRDYLVFQNAIRKNHIVNFVLQLSEILLTDSRQ